MTEYTDTLKTFSIDAPRNMAVVNTQIINTDVGKSARQELIDYHPKTGGDYQVTATIGGSGSDSYLEINPQAGGGWSPEQIALLKQLKFVPTPDKPVPGRKRVLMMMRNRGTNVRLGSTHWYLVNARIEKTMIDGKELNDVILVWEYRELMDGKPYLKPVLSSWKW